MKIFLMLFILLGLVGDAFPQEKQKIPVEFFEGKWTGEISKNWVTEHGGWCSRAGFLGYHSITKEKQNIKIAFTVYHPMEEAEKIYGFKLNYKFPTDYLLIKGQAIQYGMEERTHETKSYCEECKGVDGTEIKNYLQITVPVTGKIHMEQDVRFVFEFGDTQKGYIKSISLYTEAPNEEHFLKCRNLKINTNENTISYEYIVDRGEPIPDDPGRDVLKIEGHFYKIKNIKKSFPKDIKPNEPIKTDKRTRIEVSLPNVGKVNIAENTQVVFKSENLLEIAKGKIHSLIKKLKPKTKFEIKTPTSVAGIRGTEYHIEVEDDWTTTLIVLDDEVEISDLDKKKTVIVKKNQKSIVKPGKLPSEPENINPEQILEWWK